MLYSDQLGFYFMIFQPNPSKDQVRAWIDGDDAYKFYTYDEMVAMAKSLSFEHASTMRRSLRDTSFFLWDVDSDTLRSLTIQEAKTPIKEVLAAARAKQRAEDLQKDGSDGIPDTYYQHDIQLDQEQ